MTQVESSEVEPSPPPVHQVDESQGQAVPLHPHSTPDMLEPQSDLLRSLSRSGDTAQSIGSSSFAMSDVSDGKSVSYSDSLRIRKAYARPSLRLKTNFIDEKDFRNTDRYGFLQVQASNCDPPEMRHRAAVSAENEKSKESSTHDLDFSKQRKLLSKERNDILRLPRKVDESKMTAKEIERTKKWRDMATIERPNGGIHYRFPITKKLVQRTFKGIPDCWRATVWRELLHTQAAARENREIESDLIRSYYHLLQQDCEHDSQIDLDVPRTCSEHIFFRRRYGTGQRLLFQVLHCISLKFPEHGYVQGMAAIAATLLCYYPDDIAFVMLVRLWQDKGLQNFFSPEFDGLMSAFKVLEDALSQRAVGKKLTDLSISPPSYATRWYLTLFNYSLPFHTQLRIWDALMIADDGPALLHATALALLNGLSGILIDNPAKLDRLKDTDFEKAMELITMRIGVKDDDKLMHLVFKEAVANGALNFDF